MHRIVYPMFLIFVVGLAIVVTRYRQVESGLECRVDVIQDPLTVAPQVFVMSRNDEKSLRQQLKLTNRSRQTIRVSEVTASCGCTVIEAVKNPEIVPGGELAISFSGSPPAFGHKVAHITIETDLPSFERIVIPVRLEGGSLNAPFVSHYPKEITVSGTQAQKTAEGKFSVQAIESIGASFWLCLEQCETEELHIWSESSPSEEKISDEHVRRIYTFNIATTVPKSTFEQGRFRHTILTVEPKREPFVEMTIASRLIEQLRLVPGVLNAKFSGKSKVVLLDSRIGHEHDSIQSRVKYDWIRVDSTPVVVLNDQSIRTFEIDIAACPDEISTEEFHTEIVFASVADENELVRLPICITRNQ